MSEARDSAIKNLERKYKGFWIAIRVTKRDRYGLALRGVLVAKARSHSEVWKKTKTGGLFVFRAGPMGRRAMVL